MKKIIIPILLIGITFSGMYAYKRFSNPYVTCDFRGQLGNNMFQIATATALAMDNRATPIFPTVKKKQEWSFK